MILIGGVKPYRTVLATMTLTCGRCGNPAGHRLIEDERKLTVFFIPTVRISTTYAVDCLYCGAHSPMTKAEAQTLRERAEAAASPGTVLGTVHPPQQ
ncbi:MAG TPA: zinc-ribbon domain-containing protein [Beutenbergiaceae bacterium]|nr:zinc-ribbon domain-containing protein [Beutenbergiaceae bacterium]